MRKREKEFQETEKPLGTWKLGLIIGVPVLIVGIVITILAIKFGWIKYPFGF